MAKKDINQSKFDETTTLKLDIFRGCFREWYPVFVQNKFIDKVYVFDMFAGSGRDSEGDEGSPLILLNEAKGGSERKHCKTLLNNQHKEVVFTFNELLQDKSMELENVLRGNLIECKQSCEFDNCPYSSSMRFTQQEFHELINTNEVKNILKNKRYAKFILLDQYGFKEVDTDIFRLLVNSPKTDVVFFIASSFVKRFRNSPETRRYIDTSIIDWDKATPKEVHTLIKEYYQSLLPKDKDYFLHAFTMKKGSNYYGLIFCSGHSYGMEKFMKVCWRVDPDAGESNCEVGGFLGRGSFFPEWESKIASVKNELRKLILSGEITTNIAGLNYALKLGCRPKVFVDTVFALEKEGRIQIEGKPNKTANDIHKAKEYKIIVI